MKIDFVFAGLNLNIIIQRKCARKMHVLWIMLVNTRGIKYFNVETWMLFAPLSKFLATRLISTIWIVTSHTNPTLSLWSVTTLQAMQHR